MDINNNIELDDFELRLDELLEGIDVSINTNEITEEMVFSSINSAFDNNRKINRNVEIAVCDSIRSDLIEYLNNNTRSL